MIVSNQSTKVFPPDFFQNKKDSVINKKKQKYQSNSSSLKEKKHEDHHDLDDDSEINERLEVINEYSVDDLLDKITKSGLKSLTNDELTFLNNQ